MIFPEQDSETKAVLSKILKLKKNIKWNIEKLFAKKKTNKKHK